jgi:hypothetical protein
MYPPPMCWYGGMIDLSTINRRLRGTNPPPPPTPHMRIHTLQALSADTSAI